MFSKLIFESIGKNFPFFHISLSFTSIVKYFDSWAGTYIFEVVLSGITALICIPTSRVCFLSFFSFTSISPAKDGIIPLHQSRSYKLGLILNELGEINKLKVDEKEIRNEIEKQAQSMPEQQKQVLDYYQKNPSASANLRGSIYEEKIINLIKEKASQTKKIISSSEAQKLIQEHHKAHQHPHDHSHTEKPRKSKKPVKSPIKKKKIRKK